MERETKKFKTSEGNEVVINTFMTFKESRELQDVWLENAEITTDAEGNQRMQITKGNVARIAQDKALEIVVVSINGKTDNILEEIGSLKQAEAEEIVQEVNKITDPTSEEKKTK